jgi:hypothetical protein
LTVTVSVSDRNGRDFVSSRRIHGWTEPSAIKRWSTRTISAPAALGRATGDGPTIQRAAGHGFVNRFFKPTEALSVMAKIPGITGR